MPQYRFTPIVKDLPSIVPFVGPEAQERASGVRFRARLGANESAFGPSPKAVAAMQASSGDTWKYGDPENHDLRVAIAAYHNAKPENVMIGEGIDGLFGMLARLFIEPGVNVVSSLGSYPTFNFHIKGNGGEMHLLPYVEDHEHPDTLLAKAAETNAPLLYFSNPNNPMGTWHSAEVMQEMISNLPRGCILVLDEAYIDLAPEGTSPQVDINNPQVLRFRTFSKAYGMAGSRVGYVLGETGLIAAFDKVRNHYGMNRIGQIGAEAALNDQAWLSGVKLKVQKGRERITEIGADNGLAAIPSATNFVTLDCGRGPEFAKSLLAELLSRGIFIRMPGVEPQSRCIRVSVGIEDEVELFAEELPKALAALS